MIAPNTESPRRHVLFAAPPLRGHAAPLLAIAEELVARGHRVSFAISEIAREWVEGTGAEWVPWHTSGESVAERKRELDETFARISADPVIWRAERTMLALLARTYEPLFHAARKLVRELRPDFAVIERAALAAMDAAYVEGVPFVTVTDLVGGLFGGSALRPRTFTDYPIRMSLGQRVANAFLPVFVGPRFAVPLLQIELARRRCGLRISVRKHFLGSPTIIGATHVTEIQRPLPPVARMVGPIVSSRSPGLDPELERWLDQGRETGVVYVAFGTLAVLSDDQFRAVAEGLERTGLRVLWSITEDRRARLPTLSERFRLEAFVAQAAVLRHPSVRMLFGHAGTVTIHDALLADKPILALPFFGNQHYNAARIVDRGVGLRLDKRRLHAEGVHDTVRAVLGDPRIAEAARSQGEALRKLSGREAAADVIERSMARGALA